MVSSEHVHCSSSSSSWVLLSKQLFKLEGVLVRFNIQVLPVHFRQLASSVGIVSFFRVQCRKNHETDYTL